MIREVVLAGGLRGVVHHRLAVTLVLVGGYVLVGYPYGPVFLAVSVAVFALVDRSSTREALWVVLVAVAGLLVPQLPGVDPANTGGRSGGVARQVRWVGVAAGFAGHDRSVDVSDPVSRRR
jgi:hypothetical protein